MTRGCVYILSNNNQSGGDVFSIVDEFTNSLLAEADKASAQQPDPGYASPASQSQAAPTKAPPGVPLTKEESLALFYRKLERFGINLDEARSIMDHTDHRAILVPASAGAGKTTIMVLSIIRGILAGDMTVATRIDRPGNEPMYVNQPAKILICTFLKSGANELRLAFRDWCQKLNISGLDFSNITFSTIHKEVKDTLAQMNLKATVLDDGKDLVRAVMNMLELRSSAVRSYTLTYEEVSDMEGIFTYARNRMDDKKYTHPLMSIYGMTQFHLDEALRRYALLRQDKKQLDFEDMSEILLDGARTNPEVEKFIGSKYDYIYVDEFQDTSQLQYEVLKYYFRGCKRVMVIGDDDQTIYSWRGSDIDIIQKRFVEDFDPVIYPLSINYRCPTNILNPIIPSIVKNPNRLPKSIKASKAGGELKILYSGTVNELVTNLLEDKSKGYNSAVLGRTNQDLLIPAIILELNGDVDFSVGKSVNMQSGLGKQIFGIMDLVTKRITPEFDRYLKLFLPRYSQGESAKLVAILKNNRGLNLFNIPDNDLRHSVPTLYPFLDGLRKMKAEDPVSAYIYILEILTRQVYNGNTPYARKAKEMAEFVKRIVLEHDAVKDLGIDDLSDMFGTYLPERIRDRAGYADQKPVKLTTVHDAKGKGWDSVYIWNDVLGNFPGSVGNRDLTEDEYQEERRVHYIAWTRAKKKLAVFTREDVQGDFLRECDFTQAQDVEVLDNQAVEFGKKTVFRVDKPTGVTPAVLFERYVEDLRNSGIGLSSDRMINYETFEGYFEREYGPGAEDHINRLLDEDIRLGKLVIDTSPHVDNTSAFDEWVQSSIEDLVFP